MSKEPRWRVKDARRRKLKQVTTPKRLELSIWSKATRLLRKEVKAVEL